MEYRRKYLALLYLGIIFAVCFKESTQRIPSETWLAMRNVTTTKQFIEHMLRKKPASPSAPVAPGEDIIFTEEGTLNPDGSNAIANKVDVERDKCEIKRVSYEIPLDPYDTNVIYWPSCVKLDQCSGCCNNEMLECAPTKEQAVPHEVLRARYPFDGAQYFEFEGLFELMFSRHLECECRCRVQQSDCTNGLHEYEADSCRCKCLNEYESSTCDKPKIWDNALCRCVCPQKGRSCLDDEVYSETTCSCVPGRSEPPANDLNQGKCEGYHCRPLFSAVFVNGACECRFGSHSQMEGSLINGQGPSTSRPIPTRAPASPLDIERVPGHPMYVERTEAPVPPVRTRRPRPTRRPRNRPRFDNIHG